jgi:diguanylate cyclase (GGDEF)-like protein
MSGLGLTDGYLENRSSMFVFLLCLVLTALVGVLDHLTGRLSSAIFYLAPIGMAAWYGSRTVGIAISAAATLAWLVADIADAGLYSHPAIPYWNATVRLALFLVIVLLISRVRATSKLHEELAYTDSLTGLYNRRAFYEHAGEEIARSRRYNHPFTVAYIDVDDFKAVNDAYGHTAGDDLLKKAASTMKHNSRSTDVIARIGGDEFAILLPEAGEHASAETLKKLARRLLRATEAERHQVTFSVGIMTFEVAPTNVREMVKLTDDLMYAVKKAGKNGSLHRTWKGETALEGVQGLAR